MGLILLALWGLVSVGTVLTISPDMQSGRAILINHTPTAGYVTLIINHPLSTAYTLVPKVAVQMFEYSMELVGCN